MSNLIRVKMTILIERDSSAEGSHAVQGQSRNRWMADECQRYATKHHLEVCMID